MTNEHDKAEVSDKIENGKVRVLQANSLVKSLLHQLKEKLSHIERLEATIIEQQAKMPEISFEDQEEGGPPKLALDTLHQSKALLNSAGIQGIAIKNRQVGDEACCIIF